MDQVIQLSDASTGTTSGEFDIFAEGISPTRELNCRLATYHIGPALDLATLKAYKKHYFPR